MKCLCSLPLHFMPQPCGLSIFGLQKAIVVTKPVVLECVKGTKVRLLKMQVLDLLALFPSLDVLNQDVATQQRLNSMKAWFFSRRTELYHG